MHRQQQEAMAVDKRSEELQKKRMSTLSLDDSYTRIILPNNETKNGKSTRNCCMRKLVASWNMCTSTAVPSQIQILTDTKKSYERLLQQSQEDFPSQPSVRGSADRVFADMNKR